jgi:hypothetical protein
MKKMNMEKINELKILQSGGNDFVKEVTKAHNDGAKRVLFGDREKLENQGKGLKGPFGMGMKL